MLKTNQTIEKIIILLTCLFVLFFTLRSCWRIQSKHNTSENNSEPAFEELTQIRDENFNLLTEVRVKEIRIEEQRTLIDSLRNAIPKSLRPGKNQVKAIERIIIKTDTILSSPTIKADSNINYIEKNDPWLSAKAEIGKDSGRFTISIRDTLTRIEIYKRHLFSKDTRTVLLQSSSPYSSIQQGYSFVIKEKKPFLVIGPSISYAPLGSHQISVGISLVFPIVKLNK